MKPPATIPTAKLTEEPYASAVCYPRASPSELQERIRELHQLDVEAAEFGGKSSAFDVPVLGKGYVGIVVAAHVRGERVALKIRRVDADRQDLRHEADMLQRANAAGVGPRFVAVGKNFLLSQLIDGDLLESWLKTHRDEKQVRRVLVDVLEQCWRLDEAGLDHGELSKAPKHLLMDQSNRPFIVDFETASVKRKAANITAVCQFLFQGNSEAAKLIAEILGQRNRLKIISTLRGYKKNTSRDNFEKVRQICLS